MGRNMTAGIRIGLTYDGGGVEYGRYECALRRRADILNLPLDLVWLAGKGRPLLLEEMPTLAGVCFTGGPDVDPARYGRPQDRLAANVCVDDGRDEIEFRLLEHLARASVPTLAICRGAQIVNVFFGGTLIADLGGRNAMHRGARIEHPIAIDPGTRLAGIAGEGGTVNSSHHQAVDRLASPFRINARAADGTLEGFEPQRKSAPFILGVQWHPESMRSSSPLSDGVLDAFLQSCRGDKGSSGTRERRPYL
jgi:putative glutamine amidotransferase